MMRNNKINKQLLESTARNEVLQAMGTGKLITAKGLDEIESKVYSKVVFNMHYNTTKQKATEMKTVKDMRSDHMEGELSRLSHVSLGSSKRKTRRVQGISPTVNIAHPSDSPNAYLNKSLQNEFKKGT